MDNFLKSRQVTLVAVFLIMGICTVTIFQSLRIMDLESHLREMTRRVEMMTAVADAQASVVVE